MTCSGPSQVFAFTTLSPTSQLSLASFMTTSSLLDFAAASPAFMVFLRTHCEEIVLAALRTQYGYIPDTSLWDCCNLLPLYTNIPPHIPYSYDEPCHSQIGSPTGRRHKRSTRDTAELLQELPMLQWLVDEEQLSENGRKLLDMLPRSEHSLGLYCAGIRGLIRYCQKYTALHSSLVTKRDINEQMQKWLQERYTPWGINEIWFVIDALGAHIDEIIPSLRYDEVRREQLLGALLYKMDLLQLYSEHDTISSSPSSIEEKALQRLLDAGVIELPSKPTATPLADLRWKVRDGSHSHWFTAPAQGALSGKQMSSSHSLHWSSGSSSATNYILGHGNRTGAGLEQGDLDQASLDLDKISHNWDDIEGMKLMLMTGVAARASRTTRAKAIGFRGSMWANQRYFVDWGMIGL